MLAAQAGSAAQAPTISATTDLETALRGADIVFSAIRVGGLAARARDERAAVRLGILGQETTGSGGVLYGLRTIPVARHIADVVLRTAPEAWMINFTNPAGMVTEATSALLGDRVIGVCDSPAGLCRRVAAALDVPFDRVWFDYAGLNHLGWLRGAYLGGRNLLPSLLRSELLLESFAEGRMFGADRLRAMGSIPNEYLIYWYGSDGTPSLPTRGEFLRRQQERFYAAAAAEPSTAHEAWLRTREERDRTYMQEHSARDQLDFTGGYEGIALAVMHAIAHNQRATLILNVRNRTAMPGLDEDAVVEVPCLVDANGAHPLAVSALGPEELSLVQTVKQVERLTINAALAGSRNRAREALAMHPLVGRQAAAALANDILGGREWSRAD